MNRRELLAGLMAAAAAGPALASTPAVNGWREAVGIVGDLEAATRFWTGIARFRLAGTGVVPAATLRFWSLDPRRASGRYALLAPPGEGATGWVRLVQLSGVPQVVGRSNAMPWDTGGIFSVMTRSQDVVRDIAAVRALGWSAFSDAYDFGFGPVQLRNAVLRSPDQANVALYERLAPRLASVPAEGFIAPWNAMQMVRDVAAAKAWYQRAGFVVLQEGVFLDPEPRYTNFAIPANLATSVGRAFVIMARRGGDPEVGRVGLMQFQGLVGRDLAAQTRAPNLGWTCLSFPEPDLAATRRALEELGVVREGEFGFEAARPAFALRSPDGAELVFVQQ